MAVYPGDTVTFFLSMVNTTGADPSVTVAPSLTIINAQTGAAVSGFSGLSMTLLSGTRRTYVYRWSIPNNVSAGDYFSIVTTSYDSVVLNSAFLDKVRVGDSRITGVVSLDATVAKDSTVAKDLTVAHVSDINAISPANSSIIAAIKNKTDLITGDPSTGSSISALSALINDIRDTVGGSWIIDKTTTPNTLTVRRISDNSVLFTYHLTDDSSGTNKLKQ
jgi:hypothetical protein